MRVFEWQLKGAAGQAPKFNFDIVDDACARPKKTRIGRGLGSGWDLDTPRGWRHPLKQPLCKYKTSYHEKFHSLNAHPMLYVSSYCYIVYHISYACLVSARARMYVHIM